MIDSWKFIKGPYIFKQDDKAQFRNSVYDFVRTYLTNSISCKENFLSCPRVQTSYVYDRAVELIDIDSFTLIQGHYIWLKLL